MCWGKTKHDSGCHPRDCVAPQEKAKNYEDQPTFGETAPILLCFPVNSILTCVSMFFVLLLTYFGETYFGKFLLFLFLVLQS